MPVHLPVLQSWLSRGPLLTGIHAETDRLAIVDAEDFQAALLDFVNFPRPLVACTHCVGTAGILAKHEQLQRAHWHEHIDKSSGEVVDYDWLTRCLITQDNNDDCNIPMRYKGPRLQGRSPLLQRLLSLVLPEETSLFARFSKSRSGKEKPQILLTSNAKREMTTSCWPVFGRYRLFERSKMRDLR